MLKNLISAPITKYMAIAIVVLISALSGAMYLSYKFYGEKQVAAATSKQLAITVKDEKVQTEKALESIELIDKAASNVRKGEKALDKAAQELQKQVSKSNLSNPTGEEKNEDEGYCGEFLTDDDVRLLQQAHCLTDGDPSDCNNGEFKSAL